MVQLLLAIIYLAFISLGLPDALLGSAWPSIYQEFHVPVSYMGIVSALISIDTVISSLMSDWMNRKLGAGKVTAISVAMTALALLGFSFSSSFWMLCLLAIPYGLGAGGVDAALNNYVAMHYSSRHMSWLHCMWGIGASVGPYIMSFALSGGQPWNMGYRYIAFMQMALTAILIFSLPLWKKNSGQQESTVDEQKPMTFGQVLSIRGVKAIMLTFFCLLRSGADGRSVGQQLPVHGSWDFRGGSSQVRKPVLSGYYGGKRSQRFSHDEIQRYQDGTSGYGGDSGGSCPVYPGVRTQCR